MNRERIARELIVLARGLVADSVKRTYSLMKLRRPSATVTWEVTLMRGSDFGDVASAMDSLASLAERQIKTFERRGELLQRGAKSVSGGGGSSVVLRVSAALQWPEGTLEDAIHTEMKKARFRDE